MDRFHLMIEALQGSPLQPLPPARGRSLQHGRAEALLSAVFGDHDHPPARLRPAKPVARLPAVPGIYRQACTWRPIRSGVGGSVKEKYFATAPDPAGSIVTRSKIVVSFPSVIAIW